MTSEKLSNWFIYTIAGIAVVSVIVYVLTGGKKNSVKDRMKREHMVAEFYQPKSLLTKFHTG